MGEEYFEKFVHEVVKTLGMEKEEEKQFRKICRAYGVDWKLGE